MLLGQGAKVVLQAAYFVVVARYLGVQGFGAFAGAVALVALIAPMTSLGALSLMIRNIVRDHRRTAQQFALTLALTAISGAVVTSALLLLRHLVSPPEITAVVLLCVCGADLFASRWAEAAGGVYWAAELMGRTAMFQVAVQASRAVGAVALALAPIEFNLQNWCATYLFCTAIPAVAIMVVAFRRVGLAAPDWRGFKDDWKQGLLFSLSMSSQSVYNDIDKAMLAKFSTLEATGVYTAAYRLIDMAFVPMRALLAALHPRFFREGANGITATARLAKKMLPPGMGYCAVVAVVLAGGADLVPLILGADYEESVDALRVLALLPLLKVIHYLPSDALTGAGRQGARSVAQGAVAIVNIGLNLALIPIFGYWGAVWASLASDALLAVAVWGILGVQLRRARGGRGLARDG